MLTKTAGRASHRLQVQSTPTTAQAAQGGQEESQEAEAVGPEAALQISDAMIDTACVEEAPLLCRSEADAHTEAGVCDRVGCCGGTESGNVACEHTVGGGSEPQPNSAVQLPAARSRLLGLQMPWHQAAHQSKQVSCTSTSSADVDIAYDWHVFAYVRHCEDPYMPLQCKLVPASGSAGCPYAHTVSGYRLLDGCHSP